MCFIKPPCWKLAMGHGCIEIEPISASISPIYMAIHSGNYVTVWFLGPPLQPWLTGRRILITVVPYMQVGVWILKTSFAS